MIGKLCDRHNWENGVNVRGQRAMAMANSVWLGRSILSAILALAPLAVAHAQDKPNGPPPGWGALMRCAAMSDGDAELSCYRAAMKDAGFVAGPSVAAAEHRRRFGLAMPSLNLLKHAPKERAAAAAKAGRSAQVGDQAVAEVDEDLLTVEIDEVSLIPPWNKLLLVTTDGAVWVQLDTESVNPRPKKGQTIQIRRTRFGGYFCKFDRVTAVRCNRTH